MHFGDATCNGIIDIADYGAFADLIDATPEYLLSNWYQSVEIDPNVYSCAAFTDFNDDKIIDIADYAILIWNWDAVRNMP